VGEKLGGVTGIVTTHGVIGGVGLGQNWNNCGNRIEFCDMVRSVSDCGGHCGSRIAVVGRVAAVIAVGGFDGSDVLDGVSLVGSIKEVVGKVAAD